MSGSRKSFPLMPAFQAESYTIDSLERIVAILKKHQVEELKFTSGNHLGLSGLTREELIRISHELREFSTPRATGWCSSLQVCPGREYCRHGLGDGETLARRIEEIELPGLPSAKIKVGIAGCGRCCTEPFLRDIGLIYKGAGWTLIFGGNAGGRPRIGDVIAQKLTAGQAVELIRRCLTVYQENAGRKMRTARFIESFGKSAFLEEILKDS